MILEIDMYGHNIIAMVDRLVDSGLVRYQDKQKAIDTIGPYWVDRVAFVWSVCDIQGCDNTLTREQAREVLELLHDKHDAEIGVNWEVIRARIKEYKNDNS
jgi:hypothetical protein